MKFSIHYSIVLSLITLPVARAIDTLPYSSRTHAYSGWSTTVTGDIRTVGMSGATMGLADTFIATLDNPAGLAMTLNGADSNFATNTFYDGNIQNYNSDMDAYNFGVALNDYPWGFSLGYSATNHEGQPYLISTSPNDPASLSITTRELHLTISRLLFNNHLALGLGWILGQAEQEIQFGQATQYNTAYHSYAISGNFGASYRLPKHFVLGFGYRPALHYAVNASANPTPGLPGFFQSIDVPSRVGLGIGWIPNRFFRADLSTFMIGITNNTFLLKNDTSQVGQSITIQPRAGFAYNFLDFKELKGTFFFGSYYETSRIQGAPSRIHETIGFEMKPWIFTLGAGLDSASNYKNYLASLGVDIFKVMEKLDIIPTLPHPPYAGALPPPDIYSSEGIPNALVHDGRPNGGQSVDPIKIGLDIPKRIEEKAKKVGTQVMEVISSEPKKDVKKQKDAKKSPAVKQTQKVLPSTKRKTQKKIINPKEMVPPPY